MKKLNIGCGWNKEEGFINIDKAPEVNPDKVVNIEEGLPFENNYFDYIYSEHTLEHIKPQYWKFVLEEISRVAKDGCVLKLKLPFDNIGTRTNIDHYRTFSFGSFDQLLEEGERNYYSNLKLKHLYKKPNKLIRIFFYLFPFFKHEVNFKFKIIK